MIPPRFTAVSRLLWQSGTLGLLAAGIAAAAEICHLL
jgi:hypothetical protein